MEEEDRSVHSAQLLFKTVLWLQLAAKAGNLLAIRIGVWEGAVLDEKV
jgi:hypothetical protein